MFILYLIGILCSLLILFPVSLIGVTIPGFIKWPVAFSIVLLVVFFFNLYKKDTIYIVHDAKKKIVKCGLFSPMLTYIAASSYLLGFAMLFTHLEEKNMVDVVANINSLISEITSLNVIIAIVLIVFGLLVYVLRNTFRAHAVSMRLQTRSKWYIALTIIALAISAYSLFEFGSFDVSKYLEEGYNLYLYFGVAGAVILIDLICNLISMRVTYRYLNRERIKIAKDAKFARKLAKIQYKRERKSLKKKYKRAKKDVKLAKKAEKRGLKIEKKALKKARKAALKAKKREYKLLKKELKLANKLSKKQRKVAKKADKKARKVAKKERKLAKKQAKKDKKEAKKANKKARKVAKKERKLAKKQAKKDKKAAKKANKKAKKVAKRERKLAKKQAKKDKKAAKKARKVAKKERKLAKKQAKKDKKAAKKQAKLDKKAAKKAAKEAKKSVKKSSEAEEIKE